MESETGGCCSSAVSGAPCCVHRRWQAVRSISERTFLQRGTSSSLYGGSSIEGSVRRRANILCVEGHCPPAPACHGSALSPRRHTPGRQPVRARVRTPPASHPTIRGREPHGTAQTRSDQPLWQGTAAPQRSGSPRFRPLRPPSCPEMPVNARDRPIKFVCEFCMWRRPPGPGVSLTITFSNQTPPNFCSK
jgi:hypothetical protein